MSYLSTVLADSPYAVYLLDEVSGSFVDSSGNGRASLAPGGTPTYLQQALIAGLSRSTNFPGPSGNFAYDASDIFQSSTASVECWFAYGGTPPGSNFGFISGCAEGNGGGTHADKVLLINSIGEAVFATFNGSSNACAGSTILGAGIYHIVGTVGATTKIYVNGLQDGSLPASGSFASYVTGNMLVGGAANGSTWLPIAGRRQAAAWYATELSAARVLAHYQAGLAALPQILQQLHPLNASRGFA